MGGETPSCGRSELRIRLGTTWAATTEGRYSSLSLNHSEPPPPSTWVPAVMTPGFLSKAILFSLLFVSGAWAFIDMAKCRPGWEWVRSNLRFFRTDIYPNTKETQPLKLSNGLVYGS